MWAWVGSPRGRMGSESLTGVVMWTVLGSSMCAWYAGQGAKGACRQVVEKGAGLLAAHAE